MRPFRLLAAVASSTATVLLVAACGSESTSGSGSAAPASSSPAPSPTPTENGVAELSADEILTKAKAALAGAKSVRVKAAGVQGAQKFTLNIRYAGTKATGTFGAAGQTLELRRLGKTVYLKGSKGFWTANGGEAAATLLTGKWLKTSLADKRFGQLAEITDLTKGGFLDPDGAIRKGERKTIRGIDAIGLVDKSDDGILYIATTGPAYPLQTVPKPGGGDTGKVEFLDYDKSVTVQAPPAELVIDTSKLPGS